MYKCMLKKRIATEATLISNGDPMIMISIMAVLVLTDSLRIDACQPMHIEFA